MLYREIMAVFSQIHTKHINTLCGQNEELLDIKKKLPFCLELIMGPQMLISKFVLL
jgi:hypothetical protein